MVRAPGQSDFVFRQPAPDPAEVALPQAAQVIALPQARLLSNEASAAATRWVMRATFATLLVLLLLCVVGAHIPSGG